VCVRTTTPRHQTVNWRSFHADYKQTCLSTDVMQAGRLRFSLPEIFAAGVRTLQAEQGGSSRPAASSSASVSGYTLATCLGRISMLEMLLRAPTVPITVPNDAFTDAMLRAESAAVPAANESVAPNSTPGVEELDRFDRCVPHTGRVSAATHQRYGPASVQAQWIDGRFPGDMDPLQVYRVLQGERVLQRANPGHSAVRAQREFPVAEQACVGRWAGAGVHDRYNERQQQMRVQYEQYKASGSIANGASFCLRA
jgi:hypothetical protein